MKICVIGAGNTGLAMAAQLKKDNNQVYLWNRSRENISQLLSDPTIHVSGAFEGSYKIDRVSTSLEEAVEGCELLVITIPASAYPELSKDLAPLLAERDIPILLSPGRVLGALDVSHLLTLEGSKEILDHALVAECQTSMYTCRKTSQNSVNILSIKEDVLVSCVNPKHNKDFVSALPRTLQDSLSPASSMAETSLGNVGIILHCLPLMLNAGWVESDIEFMYYRDGISKSISKVLERLDKERLSIGKALGFELESTTDWLRRIYEVEGDDIYSCIANNKYYDNILAPETLDHRYLTEDVPCGLVPLEAIGRVVSIDVSTTTMAINLANKLLERDFRAVGRNIGRLSPDGDIKKLIKLLERKI